MRPLEEIAGNPKLNTISENLVLVADPFGDFKNVISKDVMSKIIEALIEKFIEGEGLISRFRADLVTLESQKTSFRPYEIDNFYQKLETLMITKPVHLENALKKAWNDVKKKRIKLREGSRDLTELSYYTHQWRSHEKRGGSDSFEALKNVPNHGIKLYLHEKPNKGYPAYLVYGWQERLKVREAVINKLLLTIFELLEESREKGGYDKNKFYASFGAKISGKDYRVEDYFGVKILGTSWNMKCMTDGLVYTGDSQWVADSPEEASDDLRITKGRNLGIYKYSLRHKTVDTTEKLQLQVTTFVDFLFDEFFLKDNHPRYKLRTTIRELARYERENPRLYERMRKSLCNVLDFLSR